MLARVSVALWALVATIPGSQWAPTDRAGRAIEAAVEATEREGPLPLSAAVDPELRTVLTAKLLVTWSFFESGWKPDAVGDGKDGVPKSYGIMQVQNPGRFVTGATNEKVLADPVLGYRVALAVLRQAIKACGGVREGLGLYATGKHCGGASALVDKRMKLAGL